MYGYFGVNGPKYEKIVKKMVFSPYKICCIFQKKKI